MFGRSAVCKLCASEAYRRGVLNGCFLDLRFQITYLGRKGQSLMSQMLISWIFLDFGETNETANDKAN